MTILAQTEISEIYKKGTPYLSLSKRSLPNIEDHNEDWSIIRKFLKISKNKIY